MPMETHGGNGGPAEAPASTAATVEMETHGGDGVHGPEGGGKSTNEARQGVGLSRS